MSLTITQTCAKCGRSRNLEPSSGNRLLPSINEQRLRGGWRIIENKDICSEDLKTFLKDAVN